MKSKIRSDSTSVSCEWSPLLFIISLVTHIILIIGNVLVAAEYFDRNFSGSLTNTGAVFMHIGFLVLFIRSPKFQLHFRCLQNIVSNIRQVEKKIERSKIPNHGAICTNLKHIKKSYYIVIATYITMLIICCAWYVRLLMGDSSINNIWITIIVVLHNGQLSGYAVSIFLNYARLELLYSSVLTMAKNSNSMDGVKILYKFMIKVSGSIQNHVQVNI